MSRQLQNLRLVRGRVRIAVVMQTLRLYVEKNVDFRVVLIHSPSTENNDLLHTSQAYIWVRKCVLSLQTPLSLKARVEQECLEIALCT